MKKYTILLLSDPTESILDLERALDHKAFSLLRAASMDEGLEVLAGEEVDVVFVCPGPHNNLASLVRKITTAVKELPVMVATQQPTVAQAMAVARAGAVEYLEPPFTTDRILSALEKSLPSAGLQLDSAFSRQENGNSRGFARIIGESEPIRQVFSLIKKVCDTDTTVLIQGESGTGKELIAQALHFEGVRRNGPFIPVNCGAIPSELLESELFGHEKGAFTHAIRTRTGRFELADGGTVFLDEISEMSPMLQVKLLRILQERQFERIGGTRTISSDFRVIAATNRNLEDEVRDGRFRQDLFYRLNVIPIQAPSLRERPGDIPLLVDHFIEKYKRTKKKQIKGITLEALEYLKYFSWPGNVRELENMVERMVILSTGDTITIEDLPERLLQHQGKAREVVVSQIPAAGFFLSKVVADFEKNLIVQAIRQAKGVKNQAAKLLNVNRTTLLEKMKRYGLMESDT